jgi:hypothetical protein
VTLPVFDPDDDTKARKLYDGLSVADYYMLSSPRAWRTVGRLPERFPLMTRFYRRLFEGRLGFEEVASFRSVPRLRSLKISDLGAEEAFWVYDHPPVRIFRRVRAVDWLSFREAVCSPSAPPACR